MNKAHQERIEKMLVEVAKMRESTAYMCSVLVGMLAAVADMDHSMSHSANLLKSTPRGRAVTD